MLQPRQKDLHNASYVGDDKPRRDNTNRPRPSRLVQLKDSAEQLRWALQYLADARDPERNSGERLSESHAVHCVKTAISELETLLSEPDLVTWRPRWWRKDAEPLTPAQRTELVVQWGELISNAEGDQDKAIDVYAVEAGIIPEDLTDDASEFLHAYEMQFGFGAVADRGKYLERIRKLKTEIEAQVSAANEALK